MYPVKISILTVVLCFNYLISNGQKEAKITINKQIDSLIQTSRQLAATRKFDEATALVEDVEKIATENFGAGSIEFAKSLLGRARIYMGKGDMQNAEMAMLDGRKLLDSLNLKETEEYGFFSYGLCTYYHRIQKFSTAEQYCLDGLTVREKVLGPTNPETAISNNSLGVLYRAMGQYEKAEQYTIVAKNNLAEGNHKSHNYYTIVVNNLANLYAELGKYDKAELLLNEAIELKASSAGRKSADYARSISNLGLLFQNQGKYDQAKPLFTEASDIVKNIYGDNHEEYAKYLGTEAILYCILNDYAKAEPMLIEAIKITANTVGKENTSYAFTINNLANLYMQNGYYEKAEPMYVQHNEIFLKILGNQHPSYALGLGNLGLLYNILGRYEESEPLAIQAKEICLKAYGQDNITTAFMYIVHGESLMGRKQYEAARENFEVAAEVRKKLFGEDNIDFAEVTDKIGNVHFLTNDFTNAENYYLKAIEIRRRTVGVYHNDYSRSLESLAKLYHKSGDVQKAETYWLELNDQSKRQILKASSYSSENQMMAFLNSFETKMAGFNSFAFDHPSPKMLGAIYDNALLLNGYLLENKKDITKAINGADIQTKATYQEWLDIQKDLAAEYSKPVADQKPTGDLESKAEILEKVLVKTLNDFDLSISLPSWQEVSRQLKPKEVAIEFIHNNYFKPEATDSIFYAALVIESGAESPKLVSLFEEKMIADKLNTTGTRKSQYVNQLYDYKQGENQLNKLLYQPLKSYFNNGNYTKMYFAPSGIMHRINLHAIPISEKQYLGDQIQLVEMSSTRKILDQKNTSSTNNQLVLMGGIDYEMDTTVMNADIVGADVATRGLFDEIPLDLTSSVNRGGSWSYLKGTEMEISKLNQIAQKSGRKSMVFKGKQATEKEFKGLGVQASPSIIHIATHGFFFPENDEKKALESDPVFKASNDPMMRSGLILSGGNYTWKTGKIYPGETEDGILTAREISQLDLSDTELVVLSACETGLGEIKGDEGVYGLQRAFKLAGVNHLIMSLWQVPDGQTSELMAAFYTHWLQEKMGIPEAFSKAQQAIKTKYEHPYFWAGFVLLR